MVKYSATYICNQYDEKQKNEAYQKLKEIEVYCGSQFSTSLKRSLNGWVFEQVVRYYLTKELESLGIMNVSELITEQFSFKYELGKQSKIDLMIGDKILVEVKVWGFDYGPNAVTKLGDIIKSAKEQRFRFLYITRKESYSKKEESKNYRADTIKLIGEENCFFLDEEKEDNWQKFVYKVHSILKESISPIDM